MKMKIKKFFMILIKYMNNKIKYLNTNIILILN